jgi:hypothetical protein
MNRYEDRLKTIQEAIILLGDKKETEKLVGSLIEERNNILKLLRGET